jgi:hypothetical protein
VKVCGWIYNNDDDDPIDENPISIIIIAVIVTNELGAILIVIDIY